MNRLAQFLLSNSWLLIPIIIGLVNLSVRVKQKAAEQKAQRDAAHELARRRAEALRTGRPVEPVIVYDDQPGGSQAQDIEAQRKARIEALRQQRVEQLQALREKRSAHARGPSAGPAPVRRSPQASPAPQRPAQPGRRVAPLPPARPASQPRSPARTGSVAPQQKALKTRMPKLKNTGGAPGPVPKSPAVRPVRRPQIAASDMRKSARAKRVVARQQQESPSASLLQPVGGPIVAKTPSTLLSARDMLSSRAQLRQAIIAAEILDAPVAMHRPNTGPGSMAI